MFAFIAWGSFPWAGLMGGAVAAAALAAVNNFAAWSNYVNAHRGGFFNLYAFASLDGPNATGSKLGWNSIWGDDNEWEIDPTNALVGSGTGNNPVTVFNIAGTPGPANRMFQLIGPFNNTWVPVNGDYFAWNANNHGAMLGSSGLALDTTYVIADVTLAAANTYDFNLKTIGGAYIAPTATGAIATYPFGPWPPWFRSNSGLTAGGTFGIVSGYPAIWWALFQWAAAVFGPAIPQNWQNVLNDLSVRRTTTPGEQPGVAWLNPPYVDTRYNMMNHF